MILPADIIGKLEKYEKYWWSEEEEREYEEIRKDAFKLLIFIVLSQNTSSINTRYAYRELERRIGVSPQKLSDAPLKEIENAINRGGLYRIKAKRIKGNCKNNTGKIWRKHGVDI